MLDAARRRKKLGAKASAALPIIWAEMVRRGLTDAGLAQYLNEDTGKVARLLYGDRKAGRQLAAKLYGRLGVPFEAWDRPCPVKRRVHPVLVAPEAKSA